jgi:hypothetical protein
MATVAFTSLKEEASTEVSFVGEILGQGASDGRFASACYTIQPEYTFAASIASPAIYLPKEFRSSALIASGIVFFVVGVERGVIYRL